MYFNIITDRARTSSFKIHNFKKLVYIDWGGNIFNSKMYKHYIPIRLLTNEPYIRLNLGSLSDTCIDKFQNLIV